MYEGVYDVAIYFTCPLSSEPETATMKMLNAFAKGGLKAVAELEGTGNKDDFEEEDIFSSPKARKVVKVSVKEKRFNTGDTVKACSVTVKELNSKTGLPFF